MAENSNIEWTHHTFNPHVGCTKVSPACDHCYALAWSKRAGRDVWGPRADRQRTKPNNWAKPITWNKRLEGTGVRERVFCASLADVFDNHKSIQQEWRDDLWQLIRKTPNLDWLLLTKRPQNIKRYLPDDWGNGYENVWLGTTVENQTETDRRIPHLLEAPAVVRFLSCEPLLGPVDLTSLCWKHPDHYAEGVGNTLDGEWWPALRDPSKEEAERIEADATNCKLHWIITGGESGPNFRPADTDWFRSLRDQCADANVPFLFKQYEGTTPAKIKALGRELDGVVHNAYPEVR